MIGNALGDGKPKDNSTDTKTETFAEKYRKELKKDIDDLGDEEEEEEETGEEVVEVDTDATKEGEPFDGGEEEVSSKDMFDEM